MPVTTPPCPVCGATEAEPQYDVVDLVFDADGTWSFARCACGHGSLAPPPSDAELTELYERLYDPDKLELMQKVNASGFDKQLRKLRVEQVKAALGGRAVSRILDVGCGLGHFASELRDAVGAEQVYGVELNEAAGAEASGRGVTVLKQFFDDVELEAVDVVSMNHFLEHHPRPHEAVAKAASLLQPGGVLEIEVPRMDGWGRNLLGPYWWPHLPPQHLHLFTKAGLVKTIEATGLTVQATWTRGYPATITAGWMHWVRRTLGRSSPHRRNPIARLTAWIVGLAGLPVTLSLDAVIAEPLHRKAGDILGVVATRP
jgi:SAM-dependent methyltransferase